MKLIPLKNNSNLLLKKKFLNCIPNKLTRGDYVQIVFLLKNEKRRKGVHVRLNKQTGILLRKVIRRNTMNVCISILFKFEKVKFYFSIDSPQVITFKYLRKSLRRHQLLSLI